MDELLQQGKHLTNVLIQSPGMALGDPFSWVGFAFIEMASDLAQEWAESMAPRQWQDGAKSVVRGLMSDVKMNYAEIRGIERTTAYFNNAGGIFGPTATA